MSKDLKKLSIADLNYPTIVATVAPEDTLFDALGKMRKKNIGSVIVVDKENVVLGIFTERDYIKKIATQENESLEKPISEFMTPNPRCVVDSDSCEKAIYFMRLGRFRHMIVVNQERQLKGVLSIKDFVDILFDNYVVKAG